MEYFNQTVTALFSLLVAPFSALAPVWTLLCFSVIVGALLALVYGKISNQRALKTVKRSIGAAMYESVLFRHDLKTSLSAQARMFLGGCRYFLVAVPPILVLLIPSLVLLSQLNLRFGARALAPKEKAILTVTVSDENALFETDAQPSQGVSLTPPVRDLDTLQVSWRIDSPTMPTVTAPSVRLSVLGAQATHELFIGSQPKTLPTQLHSSPLWQFLYPGGSVPKELIRSIRAITVTYPEQDLVFAGVHLHWLVLFLCASLLAGFITSKLCGIEI